MGILSWFIIVVILTILIAKHWSLRRNPLEPVSRRSFLLSPVLSVRSWKKRKPVERSILKSLRVQTCVVTVLLAGSWYLYLEAVPHLRPGGLTQSYLALLPLMFLIQWASLLLQLGYSYTGWIYPAHLKYPFLSVTLSEFWSKRWATYVSDWFKEMIFSRYRSPDQRSSVRSLSKELAGFDGALLHDPSPGDDLGEEATLEE